MNTTEPKVQIPPSRKFIDLPLSNGFNTCFAAQPLPDAGPATRPGASSFLSLGLWVQLLALGRVGEGELVDFLVSENKKIKTYTVNTKEPNKAFGLKVTLKKW